MTKAEVRTVCCAAKMLCYMGDVPVGMFPRDDDSFYNLEVTIRATEDTSIAPSIKFNASVIALVKFVTYFGRMTA